MLRLSNRVLIVGTLLALLMAAAGSLTSGATSTEKVINGGFEVPVIPGTWLNVGTTIPGWTATNACGIEIQRGVFGYSPYEGAQHVELASNCASGVVQEIDTVPGIEYILEFAFAARPGTTASQNVLQVSWDGDTVDILSKAGEPVVVGEPVITNWAVHSYILVATKETTEIRFEHVGSQGTVGTFLDAVSVQELQVCALYDQEKAHKSGSTVPLKLQLCDADGNNLSSPGYVLNAVSLEKQDNTASSDVEDSGNANPDDDFRYSEELEGYIFNKSTKGLSTGTWVLGFTVNGGENVYSVFFDIR
jgi:hypothetical protein